MRNNKGISIFAVLLILSWLGTSRLAEAITMEFAPLNQTVAQGQMATIDVLITGADPLGLSAYDFSINYDSAILAFNSAVSSTYLGSSFGLLTTPTAGSVNLADFSFDLPADLLALQPDNFVLVTLAFDAIAAGHSALQFGAIILGDASGAPLTVPAPLSANIRVQQASLVPEPATLLLFAAGAGGLVFARRLKQAK